MFVCWVCLGLLGVAIVSEEGLDRDQTFFWEGGHLNGVRVVLDAPAAGSSLKWARWWAWVENE